MGTPPLNPFNGINSPSTGSESSSETLSSPPTRTTQVGQAILQNQIPPPFNLNQIVANQTNSPTEILLRRSTTILGSLFGFQRSPADVRQVFENNQPALGRQSWDNNGNEQPANLPISIAGTTPLNSPNNWAPLFPPNVDGTAPTLNQILQERSRIRRSQINQAERNVRQRLYAPPVESSSSSGLDTDSETD